MEDGPDALRVDCPICAAFVRVYVSDGGRGLLKFPPHLRPGADRWHSVPGDWCEAGGRELPEAQGIADDVANGIRLRAHP